MEEYNSGQQYIENSMIELSEISDVIGNPPGWLLKSGISMVAIVTSILLFASLYFKYPDKLVGEGILTSDSPAIEIVTKSSGYIGEIYPYEGKVLEEGAPILYIKNMTSQDQIDKLIKWIKSYGLIDDPKEYLNLKFVYNLQLGAIQREYADLQLRFNELVQIVKDRVVFQQVENITREVNKLSKLILSLKSERSIYFQELEIAKQNYIRNQGLESEKAISKLELEQSKTVLLQKERVYEGMKNSLIQNSIKIEQLNFEKLKLKEQRSKMIQKSQFAISELNSQIKTSIATWEDTYIIKSPADGKITYSKSITRQKNINQGQIVGYIIPSDNQDQYISALMPSENIGKIEIGQQAIIKFDAFPYKEFGVVQSEVSEIGEIPEINNEGIALYEVKIPMKYTIVTDFQDTINYKPRMAVNAEVITEDKTVFFRVFDQVFSLLNGH